MSSFNRIVIINNLLKNNYIRLFINNNLINNNIRKLSSSLNLLKQLPIINNPRNIRCLSIGSANKFYITNSTTTTTTTKTTDEIAQDSVAEDDDETTSPTDEDQQLSRTIDPAIDRRKPTPVETSIKYLKSDAYRVAYGDKFVWQEYRRNHKGQIAPRKTRRTCIRNGLISTGNPCPICRDEYLVLDHRNLDLLTQFLSPHTGEVHSYSKTGLCQVKHRELLVAFERAKDYGYITYDVPFRTYDYSDYYTNEQLNQLKKQ